MTYKLISKSKDEFEFNRVTSSFADMTFVIGGFLMVFFASLLPVAVVGMPLKVFLFLFGAAFWGAAFYLPYINQKYTPETTVFNVRDQLISFKMADGTLAQIPFSQIAGFEIEIEKRSPSAANSVGIHYFHYHVNLKRVRGGSWTITSTTVKVDADKTIELLSRSVIVNEASACGQKISLPTKISILRDEPPEISWQAGQFKLTINKHVEYIECNSNNSVKAKKEFDLKQFQGVTYSYSGTIRNKNHLIVILFNQPDSAPLKLSLFLGDLNPIECLQFEQWLSQTIEQRKI